MNGVNMGNLPNRQSLVKSERVRVTFPKTVMARLDKLGATLGVDVPTLIRVMASIQLAQWEVVYGDPARLVNLMAAQAEVERGIESAFPEANKK